MNIMIFIEKHKLHFFILCLMTGLYLSILPVFAESPVIKVDQQAQDNNERAKKILQYKNDSIELELKIKHAELEVKRLLAVKAAEEEFDAKNEAIGIKYEITAWQSELKNIKATIAELEKMDNADLGSANPSVNSHDNKNSNTNNESLNKGIEKIIPPNTEVMSQIRKRQRALIEESYTLAPADAALNLAKAKALEPLLSPPLFGQKSPLGGFFPATSTTKYYGMMIHMGGNQYMLETYLRPGKQEFVIGNNRFLRIVPVQYDGVLSLVLLDAQDVTKPTLEYFAK